MGSHLTAPLARPPALRLPQTQTPAPSTSLLSTSHLVSAALRFGLRQAHVDDVLLALASPEAFWLLRDWREKAFGNEEDLRRTLEGARSRILAAARSGDEPSLRGVSVSVRPKGLWSTFHKAAVRKQQVHDVLALRVVVPSKDEEDCFEALEALRRMYPALVTDRFKDYVTTPKANGYRALHEAFLLPDGHEMEIQLRTSEMHRDAEFGCAAHRQYKGPAAAFGAAIVSGLAHANRPLPHAA